MKWSFKVGTFWGIDVYLHLTFLLVLAYVGLQGGASSGSIAHGLSGVLLYASLFTCVLLHEFGHAMAARRYGIPTRDITLLPIGGVARLERLPTNPRQELVIAIAGPLVNVVLAGALAAFLILGHQSLLPTASGGAISLAQQLFVVNVSLVLFNMLPAFPMDGGRVLRALLAMALNPVTATRIAANVGRAMAMVFAGVALWYQMYVLFFIAIFVWLAAGGEARAMEERAAAGGPVVGRAMRTRFQIVTSPETIGTVAGRSASGRQIGFPVVDQDRLVGMLMEDDVMDALGRTGPTTPVGEVMRREFVVLRADDPLQSSLTRLYASGLLAAPVLWQERLVGVLVLGDVDPDSSHRAARSDGEPRPPILEAPNR